MLGFMIFLDAIIAKSAESVVPYLQALYQEVFAV